MSTFEQNIEKRDDKIQYLLVAAEPYETVAFKIPNQPIDRSPERFFTHWDVETGYFYIQFFFAQDDKTKAGQEGAGAEGEGENQNMEEGEASYEIEDEGEGGGYSP